MYVQNFSLQRIQISLSTDKWLSVPLLYPELACEFFEILHSADEVPKSAKYRRFLSKVLRTGAIHKTIPLGLFAMEKCLKKWI